MHRFVLMGSRQARMGERWTSLGNTFSSRMFGTVIGMSNPEASDEAETITRCGIIEDETKQIRLASIMPFTRRLRLLFTIFTSADPIVDSRIMNLDCYCV